MVRSGRVVVAVLALLPALAGCGDGRPDVSTASGPPGGPATPSTMPNPAATMPNLTVASGRRVTWMSVTFTIPSDWQDFGGPQTFAAGPRIYDWRGYAVGRINAVAGFDGSIDELNPRACLRHANQSTVEWPSSYTLLESGLAPVGDRTAQFRRWSATCSAGVQEHRAWVLPQARIAIYEVCHSPDTVAIARSALVSDPERLAPAARPPWPNDIPGSCRDDLNDAAAGP